MKRMAALLLLIAIIVATGWALLRSRPEPPTPVQARPPVTDSTATDAQPTPSIAESSERAMAWAEAELGVERTEGVEAAIASFNDEAGNPERHAVLVQAITDGRLDRAAGLYWQACDDAPEYASALLSLLLDLYDERATTQAAVHLGKQALTGEDRVGTHRNLAAVMWAAGSYHAAAEQVTLCRKSGGELDELFLEALRAKGVRVPD